MNPSNPSSIQLPQGFIPVMLTPFLENGAIDFSGLRNLTEMYINAGATGLFANCLSSEMYELTPDERIAITETVLQQAAGRVPVVATGTLGGTIAEQAQFVRRIYAVGVQAVIVITGLMAAETESDEVFLERMQELMALTDDIPLGMYECPVPYKRVISAEILEKLLPTGRLVYHKDTCLDAEEVKRRIEKGSSYNFGLYDAYMVNAESSLQEGAAGLSCIQGNIYPELVVWICNHYNDETKLAERAKVNQFFVDTMDLVHTAYPTIAKYSLMKRGLPISLYTRREVEPLTDTLKVAMDALLLDAHALMQEIGVTPAVSI
ncbi:4-hydroxy-tetrahydrodipicolinate synthase [Dyadobacter jejuensis]|uniref:4-hydroxy-tetrahydrodipicolinate synthase n=1 Tax=Dyadobacter jejuensis TaxID=1082580 RepID=A0A316AQ75_9BACT|nr:dihydrodipicolinate synthase family protein [Dyadobacter jejuensis]PWJ59893.1 4-hydroxy-tetrahydrodipicolinate synthase [Dyadobacter jejuensis]